MSSTQNDQIPPSNIAIRFPRGMRAATLDVKPFRIEDISVGDQVQTEFNFDDGLTVKAYLTYIGTSPDSEDMAGETVYIFEPDWFAELDEDIKRRISR